MCIVFYPLREVDADCTTLSTNNKKRILSSTSTRWDTKMYIHNSYNTHDKYLAMYCKDFYSNAKNVSDESSIIRLTNSVKITKIINMRPSDVTLTIWAMDGR